MIEGRNKYIKDRYVSKKLVYNGSKTLKQRETWSLFFSGSNTPSIWWFGNQIQMLPAWYWSQIGRAEVRGDKDWAMAAAMFAE